MKPFKPGSLQRAIIRILQQTGPLPADHLRLKLYPELETIRTKKKLTAARVRTHRAINSLVMQGYLNKAKRKGRQASIISIR